MENKKFSIKIYLITMVISIVVLSLFLWLVGGAELAYFSDTKKVLINLGMSFGFSLFFVPLIVFSIFNWKKSDSFSIKGKFVEFLVVFLVILMLDFLWSHFLGGEPITWRSIVIAILGSLGMTLIF
ncbi:hypothetical protein [Lactobacillus sp. LL6]|uniref:hypothetical protein n=1 Tax=Lactobacillus sp. LL6 TaxID=2596827 RepID=UPI00118503C4|nr:hypothetical protein [Lactobacillus sp. LL6]TSO26882.1 hypothetical protein FOD82_07630 [Lactobacillus sp. LL6]